MSNFEKNFKLYLNAGLPILYVDTFEDANAKKLIEKICKQNDRK